MHGWPQRADDIQRRKAAPSTPGIERLIDSPHRFAQTRRCVWVFPGDMGAVFGLLRAVDLIAAARRHSERPFNTLEML
jgi:hypothetical protein